MNCRWLDATRWLMWLAILSVAAGCTAVPQSRELREQPPADLASSAAVEGVPFFPQQDYQCGPAALATALAFSGSDITDAQALVSEVYLPARQGSLQPEMLAAARRHGRIAYRLAPRLDDVLREIDAGRPVVVLQNLGLDWLSQWHYAVAVAYDLQEEELILRSGTERRHRVSLAAFERTWRRGERWAFVLLRPGEVPATAEQTAYVEALAAFEQVNDGAAVTRAWQAGAKQWPRGRLVHLGLANHLLGQARHREAADVLQQLLEHHPEDPDVHNNLAHALLGAGALRRAHRHAERAVRLGGARRDQYRDTLARIEARL